jgi:HKD family nuclease
MAISEYKSISAKISREEFTLIDEYCKKKDITPSSLIRELLLKEIKVSVPHHVAGSNNIIYNKDKDNFSWNIELDDGTKVEVIKNVSAKYLEQLQEKITEGLTQREHIIKKIRKDSVPVPSLMLGRRK